jgi:hypothetical protein
MKWSKENRNTLDLFLSPSQNRNVHRHYGRPDPLLQWTPVDVNRITGHNKLNAWRLSRCKTIWQHGLTVSHLLSPYFSVVITSLLVAHLHSWVYISDSYKRSLQQDCQSVVYVRMTTSLWRTSHVLFMRSLHEVVTIWKTIPKFPSVLK